jgi:phospholipase/carboxylesterase
MSEELPPRIESGARPFAVEARYLLQLPRADDGMPPPLLVALHGQGMTADGLLRLLDFPSAARRMLLVPEGPFPFERRRKGQRDIGHAWYLYRGDQDEFRHYLEQAEQHLLGVLEDVKARHPVDARRTVLMGFSQGGYLAGFAALRNSRAFAGLVLANTRLKHEFLQQELKSRALPVTLVVHAENDPSVRWEAARKSVAVLERAGAAVQIAIHHEGHRLPADFGAIMESWFQQHHL